VDGDQQGWVVGDLLGPLQHPYPDGGEETHRYSAGASNLRGGAGELLFPLELDLFTAMDFGRPPVLFEEGAAEVDTLKCKSHYAWTGRGLNVSYSKTITLDIKKMLGGLRGELRHEVGDTSLAGQLLSNVENQFNALINFIDTFYHELTTVANFPSVSAWKLIGRCLGGFFQSMVPVRSEAAMLTKITSVEQRAHLIWTVLQCHSVVEDFIALDFNGHTVMVQQMTLYMMTERVDPVQMERLKTIVNEASKSVAEMVKQVKSLADQVATNKRNHDNLLNKVNTMKQKMKLVK
jgi:hypothetical protein